MNCDKCKFYIWYYDWCKKWRCEVDGRAVYPCFEVTCVLVCIQDVFGDGIDNRKRCVQRCWLNALVA